MITFYATPNFPSSECSYDVQIWPLSFALCLTQFVVLRNTVAVGLIYYVLHIGGQVSEWNMLL